MLYLVKSQCILKWGYFDNLAIVHYTSVFLFLAAPVKSMVCGAWAGLGAKMAIYPLDMLKKRLQIQGFESGRAKFGRTDTYHGLIHCVKTVSKKEGILAFYKGLSPSLVKAAVSVSFHFLTYEWCCHLLGFYYHASW